MRAEDCCFALASGQHALGVRETFDKETKGRLKQASDKPSYNLGNGKKSHKPEEAAKFLVEREFPDAGKLDAEPLFIPDFFRFRQPQRLNPDHEREYGRMDSGGVGDMRGDSSERKLYDFLHEFYFPSRKESEKGSKEEKDEKGIMVLHSWINRWTESFETDFVIVSPTHNVVVIIEVKHGEAKAKGKGSRSVATQLEKRKVRLKLRSHVAWRRGRNGVTPPPFYPKSLGFTQWGEK